ncbi:MAG: hypothetical protein CL726_08830 [Chloroflexi bacterium]|jgi:hypothetical protein|nr:hypothetical protein [Chloroflexota bacterium]|tara:strand:+ start:4585 stop:4902 length:318 start_codon:yes stop_codon:yes gene_type:complete
MLSFTCTELSDNVDERRDLRMIWEVLTTAPDQLIGESWCGLIQATGIECRIRPGDAVGFLGVSVFPVRIMVRASDIELAQSILDTYLAEDEEPLEGYSEEPESIN